MLDVLFLNQDQEEALRLFRMTRRLVLSRDDEMLRILTHGYGQEPESSVEQESFSEDLITT